MSWDVTEKRIKCPCGQGEISQVRKDDDWGRTIEYTPTIECPVCAKKYRVESQYHQSYKPGRGDWTNYFLVPKGLKPSKAKRSSFPGVNGWELARKDFSEYLIVFYPKSDLIEAASEVSMASSVSSLEGAARSIAKAKRSYTKSCTIKDLRPLIESALGRYDSYRGNHEQREEESDYNSSVEEEYEKEVQKQGILLDF